MIIKCPHCNKDIELSQDIIDTYYNWKCPNCNEMIQLKGFFDFIMAKKRDKL